MALKIYSWNLNGIRAAARNGFFDWLKNCDADIILLQEVRANIEQMEESWLTAHGYKSFWFPAEKKGYSGVGIFTRLNVSKSDIQYGMNNELFDKEGRFITLFYNNTAFVSSYFPNSQAEGARLDYKILYCEQARQILESHVKNNLGIVIGGDFNIAHKPIDLANPKQNEKNPGYLPGERQWMSKFIDSGFVDTFRMFNETPENYTWWSNRFNSREKNIGWRIDYHFVNEAIKDKVINAKIYSQIMGSDHCPVSIELSI